MSLTTDGSGAVVSEQKFTAWGMVRAANGAMPTALAFTGQYADATGLTFMQARYYDAYLNRWISPDSIVPDASNPQDLNRYSYARNNPVRYVDPTGHCVPACVVVGVALVVAVWEIIAPYNATPVGGGLVDSRGQPCGSSGCVSQGPSDFEVASNVARDAAIAYTGVRLAAAIAASLCFDDGDCTNEARAAGDALRRGHTVFESSAPQVGNVGYRSFDAFKRAMGSAGEENVWHHIVEQRAVNVERFGAAAIHNTINVIKVSREVNQAIADYYSRIRGFTNGMTVREWLTTQSFEDQFEFGQRILDMVQNGGVLP
ncbi:MAG: RHS repeat-associated core domain-containing protein [Chloroflexi bacterium]|nr:RHS repeat-associated core domain-containing protein [Chloroflexota bacterium]